jgi:uncharacterized membrane protein YkoI
MRNKRLGSFLGVATLALLLGSAVRADEEKVALAKVPGPILAAVKKQFPGAKLVAAGKEKEDGKTVYEVSLQYKGHNYDVTATPEGKVVEVEKEITAGDLPKAVKGALDARYPKATLKKVEEITKDDKVAYEVLLVSAEKKTIEIKLDSRGKVLETEAKKGKGDD